MNNKARKVALLGLCSSIAIILAYVEVLLPPLYSAVPGIKLGLPNLMIIFILYKLDLPSAALISGIRIIIVSILFGNAVALAYSIAGAVLSLAVMYVLKRVDKFSVVGVSVAGGVLHNLGQILMAVILFRTIEIGYYFIVLSVTGCISGIIIGLCSSIIIKRIDIKKY